MAWKLKIAGKQITLEALISETAIGDIDKRFHTWWDRKVDHPLKRQVEGQPWWVKQLVLGPSSLARNAVGTAVTCGLINLDEVELVIQAPFAVAIELMLAIYRDPDIGKVPSAPDRPFPPPEPTTVDGKPGNQPLSPVESKPTDDRGGQDPQTPADTSDESIDPDPAANNSNREPTVAPTDTRDRGESPPKQSGKSQQPGSAAGTRQEESETHAEVEDPWYPPAANDETGALEPWNWLPSEEGVREMFLSEPGWKSEGIHSLPFMEDTTDQTRYQHSMANYESSPNLEWRRATKGTLEFESAFDRGTREYTEVTHVSKEGVNATLRETRSELTGEIHRQLWIETAQGWVHRDDKLLGNGGEHRIERPPMILPTTRTSEQRDEEFRRQFDARVEWAGTLSGDGTVSDAPSVDNRTAPQEPDPKSLVPADALAPKAQMPRSEKMPLASSPIVEPKATPSELERTPGEELSLPPQHNLGAAGTEPPRHPAPDRDPGQFLPAEHKSPQPKADTGKPDPNAATQARPTIVLADRPTISSPTPGQNPILAARPATLPTWQQRLESETLNANNWFNNSANAYEFAKRWYAHDLGFRLRSVERGTSTYYHVSGPKGAYLGIVGRRIAAGSFENPARIAKHRSISPLAKMVHWKAAAKSGGLQGSILSAAGTAVDYVLDPQKTFLSRDLAVDVSFDTAKGWVAGAAGSAIGAGATSVLATGQLGATLGSVAPGAGTVVGFVAGVGVGVLVEYLIEDWRAELKDWVD